MRMQLSRIVPLVALLLAGGCTSPACGQETSLRRGAGAMADLVRQYQADERSVHEAFRLPASVTFLDQQQRLQTAWLQRLRDLNFEALDRPGKLDHILLQNQIRRSLDDIARQRKRLVEIEPLVGFRDTILALEQARRQAQPIDCRAAAEKLAKLAETLKQTRERVDRENKAKPPGAKPQAKLPAGKPPAVSAAAARRAAEAVRGLRQTLEGWFRQYSGYLPEFDWWVKQPYEEAASNWMPTRSSCTRTSPSAGGGPDDPCQASRSARRPSPPASASSSCPIRPTS